MLCCGRMGPMCIPVYDVMENLSDKYKNVELQDITTAVADGTISALGVAEYVQNP
jgi:thioredoxin 1